MRFITVLAAGTAWMSAARAPTTRSSLHRLHSMPSHKPRQVEATNKVGHIAHGEPRPVPSTLICHVTNTTNTVVCGGFSTGKSHNARDRHPTPEATGLGPLEGLTWSRLAVELIHRSPTGQMQDPRGGP